MQHLAGLGPSDLVMLLDKRNILFLNDFYAGICTDLESICKPQEVWLDFPNEAG